MEKREFEPQSEFKDARGQVIKIDDMVRLSEAGREFYTNGNQHLAASQSGAEGYNSKKVSIEFRGKVIGFVPNSRVEVISEEFLNERVPKFWTERIQSKHLIVE